jgi:hypothetical protein
VACRRVSWCWTIAIFSITIGITHLNKATRCSHAWSHTEGSLRLITVIASHQIEASSSGFQSNNRKYGEKMPMKPTNWTYIPRPTMVITSPNFECGLFLSHTSVISLHYLHHRDPCSPNCHIRTLSSTSHVTHILNNVCYHHMSSHGMSHFSMPPCNMLVPIATIGKSILH